jgi:lysozyme
MQINTKGLALIKEFESCKLRAYQDSVGVWTIGWGITQYENGVEVKQGDQITLARANELLAWEVNLKSDGVSTLTNNQKLTSNQFSALVSFAYNVGLGNLKSSTLLKKVRINPNDPSIPAEFLRWNKAKGKVLAGLTRRRQAEANLYKSYN